MRTTLAVIIIVLILSLPIAARTTATTGTNSLQLTLSPSKGEIGSTVNIDGTLTIHGHSSPSYNITILFGNQSVATIPNIPFNSTFHATFFVPLVDSGQHYVTGTAGNLVSTPQPFNVTYGIDTLIQNLKDSQGNQTLVYSVLESIATHLSSLPFATQNQLNSVNQTVSSLARTVTSSNSNIQSLYQLFVVFVALEGVVIGLVIVLIIVTMRRRGPRGKLDEVEIIES